MRGLETKVNVTKLRETVDHYVNDTNYPLPFYERRGGDIDNMIILWISLHGLISNCIFCSVSENKIQDVKLFKIFLSSMGSLAE